MAPITLIIGPQKPVFCSENLLGLPGSRDDADELVDGPDRLLGVSALGGRRPDTLTVACGPKTMPLGLIT